MLSYPMSCITTLSGYIPPETHLAIIKLSLLPLYCLLCYLNITYKYAILTDHNVFKAVYSLFTYIKLKKYVAVWIEVLEGHRSRLLQTHSIGKS